MSVLVAVVAAVLLVACGGTAASSPQTLPTAAIPRAAPSDEVVGRGSAGPAEREVAPPANAGVIDTRGLPTVVFVDADG